MKASSPSRAARRASERHARSRTRIAGVAGAAAAALLLAACGSSASSATSSPTPSAAVSTHPGSSASAVALTVEGNPPGPVTKTFNPFDPTSAINELDIASLVYEPLLQFDIVKPGTIYDWLAKSYSWSNGGRTLTFHLRQGVKWSNGTPFTSADVAFTYNLIKDNPSINSGGLTISKVLAPNASTVVLDFPTAQYTNLYAIAGETYIVPKAQWASVKDPATFADANPIGTGGWTVSKFASTGITLTANPRYWGGKPKVETIYVPAYDSNTSANLNLENGTLDWAGNFVSDLSQVYTARDPRTHKSWFPGINTVTLQPNLDEFPTNQLAVRQAVSAAIDRKTISADGEDGLEPPATNASGLVLPTQKAYLAAGGSKYTISTSADPAKAEKILEAAGWKKGSNGFFQKGGKTLSITLIDPSSYTDYSTDDQIMVAELKKAGIDASFNGLSVGAWTSDVALGNFQMTLRYSNQGPTPYQMFQGWLDDSTTAPVGKSASGDFERFRSAAAEADLKAFAATDSLKAQVAAIGGLEKLVATQLPVIPVVYGAAFDEYNTTHFTNWPSPSNPYDIGQPTSPAMEVVALHLRPVH
ncbi:MAG: ABC transporter substrate-binding protein [Actinomycetota bacterium]|nr:ABC transporter substrate-binding protein [Actinomycetota bacterium]